MDDVGVLTELLTTFLGISASGYGRILPAVNWLLAIFVSIELTFLGFMVAAGRANLPLELFFKTLKIGFFIWLVTQFPTLHQAFMQSMIQMGLLAGGGTLATSLMFDPSGIALQGLSATKSIFNWFESLSGFTVVKALPAVIITGLCALVIIFCFFVIAIQVFVTLLEFYIVSLLALVLIPWGMFKQTAFMAEKSIGVIISFSVKLMVLAFIVAIIDPIISTLALPPDPSYRQVFGLTLGTMALAFLAIQAPSVASGLMMGSPSLTAGSATASMAGLALGGFMGANAVSHIGKSFGNASLMSIKAASQTYGSIKAGTIMGSATTTGGVMAQIRGGLSGAAQGLVGSTAHQVKAAGESLLKKVSIPITTAATNGERMGFVGSGGNTPSSWKETRQKESKSDPQTAPNWAIRAASNASTLAHMMSSTKGPSGGMSPKLS
jgi:type IV secretion system protein TrbL